MASKDSILDTIRRGGTVESVGSFQAPETKEEALDTIRRGANIQTTQFSSKKSQERKSRFKSVLDETGLGEEFEKVKPVTGEKPDTIYSGGAIMDVFDTLNALQYGVTGVINGDGFVEGIKNRRSFADKDLLGSKGIPGTIAGIVLDIAVDPLTYIAPITAVKQVSKFTKLAGPAKKIANKAAGSNIGNRVGKMLVYRYGQDPVYKEIAERSVKNTEVAVQNMVELVRPIANLSADSQRKILAARRAGTLEQLPKELLDTAKPAFDKLDSLSKELVDLGILDKQLVDETVGQYVPRLYRKFDDPTLAEEARKFFEPKKLSADSDRFRKAKDLPEDVREAYGEILEAGYPTAKGLVELSRVVENAKFFKQVDNMFATDVAADGFVKLSDTRRLGDLAGKYVPDWLADDVNEMTRTKSALEKTLNNAVGTFKYSKVILNPATHARNMMSNFILNDFEGLSPARLDIYKEAITSLAKRDGMYKEAVEQGLGRNTFAAQEIKGFLQGADSGLIGKIPQGVRKNMDRISNLYEKEEEFAKLAQYIFQRRKGLSPEDAWKVSERATFNYSQVTPFIRRLRESIFGYPFVTFTYKVTPQVARTLATKPGKISKIGKIKEGIEEQVPEEEREAVRATEPQWVRDGFYLQLPVSDSEGRSMLLDLTYILPFGDLATGQIFQRGINTETGFKESVADAAVDKLPFVNTLVEITENQDFFGNKIYRESDPVEKQISDIGLHLIKFMTPPLLSDNLPGGYRPQDGTRRIGSFQRAVQKGQGAEGAGKQSRDVLQELLRNAGIKLNPVDIETQENWAEFVKDRAIQTFLEERGEIGTYEIPFQRKD